MKHCAKILVISTSGMSEEAIPILYDCVTKRPRLIAIFGKDCHELEDICDKFIEESDMFVTTTSHPDESLEEVISMVKIFDRDELGEMYETIRF